MSRYALILLLALTGCGTPSGPYPSLPPTHLLKSCPEPSWPVPGGTNADLARLLGDYILALDLCNADKAGLRDWAESLQGPRQQPRD